MILRDVAWAEPVNILVVECCGARFAWSSRISCVTCPLCGRRELWHDVEPKGGVWVQPVMENRVQ